MRIHCEQLADEIYKINLEGRMDIIGTQDIDLKFTGMTAAPRQFIIVDLSGVDFLASIGIRTLLINAKAVKDRGGKMVLLNPDINIEKVLLVTGIDVLIPIFDSLELATESINQDRPKA